MDVEEGRDLTEVEDHSVVHSADDYAIWESAASHQELEVEDLQVQEVLVHRESWDLAVPVPKFLVSCSPFSVNVNRSK